MSDADTMSRRTTSERPKLSLETYLTACREKGAPRQEDRAALFGMPRRTLLRYELSKVEPRVTVMRHIAARLGLTLDELWPAA
jgi:transcriptional regulator with XRE-family HTH domain